jgi:hypothetical protein
MQNYSPSTELHQTSLNDLTTSNQQPISVARLNGTQYKMLIFGPKVNIKIVQEFK